MMISVEQSVTGMARKPKYSDEKTYSSATLFTTNPTGPDPDSNPDHHGGKSATNRLSYGTALNARITLRFDI
jgi:hypothetical protein